MRISDWSSDVCSSDLVDRHQLENAMLNLAVNARDAMDGKGTLTISTGQRYLEHHEIGESEAGDYVVLSIKDTGVGMPPEILSRVFEPFFTTKPVGKGTGLGLSQIFGFIGQSRGEIQILSHPGQGTEVDRKSVVEGKSVSVSVDYGGRRFMKKKTTTENKI